MKQLLKHLLLWLTGGVVYITIELIYRGYTHWTMFILGGLCFCAIGSINEFMAWETPLLLQCIIGGIVITILEFITGCIVNLWLGWDIWNYTRFDVLGQISLPFFFIWCLLSLIGIILDDYLRYWWFKESVPRYKIL